MIKSLLFGLLERNYKMIIWTYKYNPFQMDGRLSRPFGCNVEVGEPVELGKGYFGYEVKSPSGRTVVAEKSSGAIAGNSIEQVREDIALCNNAQMMDEQIKQALINSKLVDIVPLDEFWSVYERVL
jgi:hypothetical protein